ncbi:PKD domain-containing protein [Fibrisoma montanum]|uniref:PKD domain-containing protein n=1 Tax=Fibrisoma montanum TaxID=2305895 RepID=A0A418LXT9_9BACT|nr:PKD domain-containing protein [Fibrisoma montanum]RIV18133.1 PKD domain-containing protein [Fibrisoma montanum]
MHRVRFLFLGMVLALTACEPFNLERKTFPTCAQPRVDDIGYTADQLDVTFFLVNPQGDIGAVGWDFGDGKNRGRVGTRVTYSYDRPGTYTVTIVIANRCNDSFTATREITIRN